MTGDEWLAAFAAAAGVPAPSADEIAALLELAGVAAHASERTAAPVTCWIAAQAGLAPADAVALAESLARSAG
jgi:Domain of unknown function (DUF6457)